MPVKTGWSWGAALLGLGLSALAQAGQIYRCQAYGGGHFWSPNHCQQYRALVERVQTVPDGLPFERQVRVAEQAIGGGGKTPTVSTEPNKAEQQSVQRRLLAEQRQRARCQRWQAESERQRALARQPLKAKRQEAIARQQERLQQQLTACVLP